MKLPLLTLILVMTLGGVAHGQDSIATLRGGTPLDETARPPATPRVINSDLRQTRNYPEQPPLIPHRIDGYQIDLNANKCLTCHSRKAVGFSQAPMVSVTHFMNRNGQFLASVTPRRYYCNQCHVVQTNVKSLVDNGFVDVDSVLEYLDRSSKGME